LSSLGLVLIVTPVLFYWLREREIGKAEAEGVIEERASARRPGADPAD
jgi:hypothetical protein